MTLSYPYHIVGPGGYVVSAHFSEAEAEAAALTMHDHRLYRILSADQAINPYYYYNGKRLIDSAWLVQRLLDAIPDYGLEMGEEDLFTLLTDDHLDWAHLNPSPKLARHAARPFYAFVCDLLGYVAHSVNWPSLEKK